MATQISEIIRSMEFQWMSLKGLNCSCSKVVHPGLSCLKEILLKFITTAKYVSKFYIIFHLIPYVLKFKKMYREGRLLKGSLKSMLSFAGSILFMVHLVCGLKTTLCLFCNLGLDINGYTYATGAIPTGIAILWQSASRRQQIAYYASVRAFRSAYEFLLRRGIIVKEISHQVMLVLVFGVVSYIYTQHSKSLKYLNMFEGLWGNF